MAWIVSVLSLLVGVSGFLLEKQKLDAAEVRAEGATRSEQRTRAELTDLTDANRALGVRVQELQAQLGKLTTKVAAARPDPETRARPSKKARRKHGKRHRH